jgi:hypothetical protein
MIHGSVIRIFELKAVAASRQRVSEKGEEGTVGFVPPFILVLQQYSREFVEYCYLNKFVYSFIC